MNPFTSLFAKIIGWFFLNIVLVIILVLAVCIFQFHVDFSSFVGRRAANSLRTAGLLISQDLRSTVKEKWAETLSNHARIHGVDFVLMLQDGARYSSNKIDIPDSVVDVSTKFFKSLPPLPPFIFPQFREKPPMFAPQGNPSLSAPDILPFAAVPIGHFNINAAWPLPEKPPHPMRLHRILLTREPTLYWTGDIIPVFSDAESRIVHAVLFAVTESITGQSFFFDPFPLIAVAALVALFSALFWIPMVFNISRPIARMTRATEAIAVGKFNVTVKESRHDEIGRLARAISHMTARLQGYVQGQKRFLADVAHELRSPLARIQLGLGILELHLPGKGQKSIADVEEDVVHMSCLIDELLNFSRAELTSDSGLPVRLPLLSILNKVINRENIQSGDISTRIEPDLHVLVQEDLFIRAMANLIRNALAYSPDEGRIVISAQPDHDMVEIQVIDQGPGIPSKYLSQIFEPFFRVASSRDRETGGVGLGLFIARTCIEGCNGHVSAKNLPSGGFMVSVFIPKG